MQRFFEQNHFEKANLKVKSPHLKVKSPHCGGLKTLTKS